MGHPQPEMVISAVVHFAESTVESAWKAQNVCAMIIIQLLIKFVVKLVRAAKVEGISVACSNYFVYFDV